MKQKPKELTCQVCESELAVGVACSVCGPISVAFGRKCLEEGAEPLWLVHSSIDCIGGPKLVAEWFKGIRSYKDGRYIGWEEIVSCYVPSDLPEADTDDTENNNPELPKS